MQVCYFVLQWSIAGIACFQIRKFGQWVRYENETTLSVSKRKVNQVASSQMVRAAAVQGFIIQHTYYMVLIIVKKIQFQINMDKQSVIDEFDLDLYLWVVANVFVVVTFINFSFFPLFTVFNTFSGQLPLLRSS